MADNDIIKQNKTGITSPHGELFKDACSIIEQARAAAYRSVNDTLIKRNWLLGLRIQHEVLKDQRAEYGEQVIMKLAEELIDKYGRGFKKSNLYLFVSFYQNHPDFFQLPIGKSLDMADDDIFQSLTGKFPIRLPGHIIVSFFKRKQLMAVCGTNKKLQPKCGILVLCNATCHHNTTIAC